MNGLRRRGLSRVDWVVRSRPRPGVLLMFVVARADAIVFIATILARIDSIGKHVKVAALNMIILSSRSL